MPWHPEDFSRANVFSVENDSTVVLIQDGLSISRDHLAENSSNRLFMVFTDDRVQFSPTNMTPPVDK
jgi:hypothetical protein